MTETAEDQALEALKLDWDDAYVFGVGLDGFWASRRDDLGGEIRGEGPDELRCKIQDDYAVRPVRVH